MVCLEFEHSLKTTYESNLDCENSNFIALQINCFCDCSYATIASITNQLSQTVSLTKSEWSSLKNTFHMSATTDWLISSVSFLHRLGPMYFNAGILWVLIALSVVGLLIHFVPLPFWCQKQAFMPSNKCSSVANYPGPNYLEASFLPTLILLQLLPQKLQPLLKHSCFFQRVFLQGRILS